MLITLVLVQQNTHSYKSEMSKQMAGHTYFFQLIGHRPFLGYWAQVLAG